MENIDKLYANNEQINLVQITDTHLFANDEEQLLGVPTAKSFDAVIDQISLFVQKEKELNYQAIVMSGDVSQDHSVESYQRFIAGIAPLTKKIDRPCYWIPGNHDEAQHMLSQDNQANFTLANVLTSSQVLLGKHWQMVLLNSQKDGSPHGYLNQKNLDMMIDALQSESNRYTIIFMHHHCRPMGSEWLDNHDLHNAEEFWQAVAPYANLKAVVCGHVHQDFHQVYQNVEVISTPSTCMQFKPHSNTFALDDTAPGWRLLTLKANGQLETKLYRLPQGSFLPDADSKGY